MYKAVIESVQDFFSIFESENEREYPPQKGLGHEMNLYLIQFFRSLYMK